MVLQDPHLSQLTTSNLMFIVLKGGLCMITFIRNYIHKFIFILVLTQSCYSATDLDTNNKSHLPLTIREINDNLFSMYGSTKPDIALAPTCYDEVIRLSVLFQEKPKRIAYDREHNQVTLIWRRHSWRSLVVPSHWYHMAFSPTRTVDLIESPRNLKLPETARVSLKTIVSAQPSHTHQVGSVDLPNGQLSDGKTPIINITIAPEKVASTQTDHSRCTYADRYVPTSIFKFTPINVKLTRYAFSHADAYQNISAIWNAYPDLDVNFRIDSTVLPKMETDFIIHGNPIGLDVGMFDNDSNRHMLQLTWSTSSRPIMIRYQLVWKQRFNI